MSSLPIREALRQGWMESGGQDLALVALEILGNTMDLNATIIDDSEIATA